MKSVTTLLALAFCVAAQAGVDVEIVDKPKYWSHTNNRIVGHAEITGGTRGITAYRILINGQAVKSKTYMAGPIYRTQIDPIIMFDSTQFAHLTNLEVRLEVKTTDSPTVWIADSHSCYVKNKVGIYSDPILSHEGEWILVLHYATMNYDILVRHDAWTRSTFLLMYCT